MRAVLQRVIRASVTVAGESVATIGGGLAVLVGIAADDDEADAAYLADRIVQLRIFSGSDGKFNLSLLDVNGSLLLVSQFTLLANTRKGRRPGFDRAARPEKAASLFDRLAQILREKGLTVELGRFQHHMVVEVHNDGPVTILLDSKERFQPRGS